MMNAQKTLLLVGGGTGGHAYPLLNLFQYIQKNTHSAQEDVPEITFRWIGEINSIESRLAETHAIPFSAILCGKLRRYFSFKTLLVPFQILFGIIQSIVIILAEKPKAIFSKGGYVSLPVAVAGWILRVPIYLHESDSVPGLANRIVGRFSGGIWCSFHEADRYFASEKILGYGTLLSSDIEAIVHTQNTKNPRTQLLVSCGSQGSSAIFDILLDELQKSDSPINNFDIHLVLGMKNPQYREKFQKFPGVRIYDFFYGQKEYLTMAQTCDIVITRSGSSIFEFEALGLHMILIPHPFTGNNHQYWNARAFEKKGHECITQQQLAQELPGVLQRYCTYKKQSSSHQLNNEIYQQITQKLIG